MILPDIERTNSNVRSEEGCQETAGHLEPRPPSGQRSKKTRAPKIKNNNYVIETTIKLDEFLEKRSRRKLVTLEPTFVNKHKPPVVTLRKPRRKRVENAKEFRVRCNENRRVLDRRNKLPREIKTNAFEENISVTTTKLPPSRICGDLNLPNIRTSSALGKGVNRHDPQPPKLPNISAHRSRRNNIK